MIFLSWNEILKRFDDVNGFLSKIYKDVKMTPESKLDVERQISHEISPNQISKAYGHNK